MHEYSIVQSLLGRVEREAAARGAVAVHGLHVAIGELSGVDPELLATAYETFRQRTICAAASLRIESIPAEWCCPRCRRALSRGAILRCPSCDVPARLAAGDEIILNRIEMEVP